MKKIFLMVLMVLGLVSFGVRMSLAADQAVPATQQPNTAAGNSDLQQKVAQLQQLLTHAKDKMNTSPAAGGAAAPAATGGGATTNSNPSATSGAGAPSGSGATDTASSGDLLPPTDTASNPPAAGGGVTGLLGMGGGGNSAAAANNAGGAVNVTQGEMYDQAFGSMVNQLLPMSPDQIAKLREIFTETQRAAATPAGVPPKPTTTSLIVNLSPQAAPPVIRLGAGYISSLVFMDSTGQPWPIAAYSIGDPNAFNIQWDKKGNTLLVQSSSFFKRSNLAVILKDLNTPVMLTLLAGQAAVDYRVDLRIPGIGPNAMFVQSGLPDVANPELLDVLNGVPPPGSKHLKVVGGDAQAWLKNNHLYLRTSLDVISPAWQAIMTSIDGTHAYLMQSAPVILALQRGKDKTLTLTIEGIE